jgi:hypothetical protein
MSRKKRRAVRKGRVLGKPLSKTYLKVASPEEDKPFHARFYAPDYGVDRRGSGKSVPEAIANAKLKIKTVRTIAGIDAMKIE